MCQKAEGESNYLVAMDKSTRKRGFDAFYAGKAITDHDERTHELEQYSDAYWWTLGWKTAEAGRDFW